MNVAVTFFAASIVIVHVGFIPEHAPLQPVNVDPFAADAVIVISVPIV